MPGGRSSRIPRLVDRPGGVLVAVHRPSSGAAAFDVVQDRFQQGHELRLVVERSDHRLVVERSDHDVATLTTHRVVPRPLLRAEQPLLEPLLPGGARAAQSM
jgi:hypothetical protein